MKFEGVMPPGNIYGIVSTSRANVEPDAETSARTLQNNDTCILIVVRLLNTFDLEPHIHAQRIDFIRAVESDHANFVDDIAQNEGFNHFA